MPDGDGCGHIASVPRAVLENRIAWRSQEARRVWRAQTRLLASGRRAACPSSGGFAGPEPMPRLVLPAALPRVVDGKPRVTSFLRTDTGRRVGRGRTRQGMDPHPPETSALQGRGSHQESTSLRSLVQAPYYACRGRLGSPPCGRQWSAALRAALAGLRRVRPSRGGGRLYEACCFRAVATVTEIRDPVVGDRLLTISSPCPSVLSAGGTVRLRYQSSTDARVRPVGAIGSLQHPHGSLDRVPDGQPRHARTPASDS